MIFLGYPKGVKGYLFMRVLDNTTYIGTKAVFDERLFPKSEGFMLPRFTSIHLLKDETPSSTEIDSSMEEDVPRQKCRSPSIAPKKVIRP
jgi:hypothetical protein